MFWLKVFRRNFRVFGYLGRNRKLDISFYITTESRMLIVCIEWIKISGTALKPTVLLTNSIWNWLAEINWTKQKIRTKSKLNRTNMIITHRCLLHWTKCSLNAYSCVKMRAIYWILYVCRTDNGSSERENVETRNVRYLLHEQDKCKMKTNRETDCTSIRRCIYGLLFTGNWAVFIT